MKKIIYSALVITFLSFASFQSVSAIGMMTKPIVAKDILRGQEILVTLTLLNSENKEATYGLKAQGKIANWVSFYKIEDKNLKNPITEIKMPIKDFMDVKVKFSVPKDMPNGEYTGEVLAFLASSGEIKNDEASVNVSQQVSRKVKITVTDKEIVQLKTAFIPAEYDVQQGKPLKIRVLYDNQGNVAVKPDLQLKILKSGITVYNVIFPYPEEKEAIRALTAKEISPIEWQTIGQENGNYSAEFKVLINDKEIQSESFDFSIGYLSFNLLAAVSFLSGGNLTVAWFMVGAIFLGLAVILVMLYKKIYKKIA